MKSKFRIRDISIRAKLIVFFLMMSISLVMIVGISTYKSSSEVIDSQTQAYTKSILSQIKDRVDGIREETLKVTIPIVINPQIQNNDLKSLEIADYISLKAKIVSEMALIMFIKNYISSIYICYNDGSIISSEQPNQYDIEHFIDYEVYKTAINESTKPVWLGVHENEFMRDPTKFVFSYVRSLYSRESFQPFAVLVINVPSKVLDDICSNDNEYNIYIIQKDGQVIYSRNAPDTALLEKKPYISEISNSSEVNGSLTWKSEDGSYNIQFMTSNKNDWIYIAEMPLSYTKLNSDKVKDFTTIVLFVCCALSLIASLLISYSITAPLRKMITTMKKVQGGDFTAKLDVQSRNELGHLADNFSRMMSRVSELMEGIKFENMQKREAEINALQAQITPHFLYNVLNSIRCMARVLKVEGIEKTIENLIVLLQLSISRNTVFIYLSEEIDIIDRFVQIQNFRYGNEIRIEYFIESEIMKMMTLKFILQPLIENAIIHGFDPRGGNGNIQVFAHQVGKDLVIEIDDDGVGIDPNIISSVYLGEYQSDRRFNGIGIKNINERLSMHFGDGYGVSLSRTENHHTIATVSIPVILPDEVPRYV